MPASCGKGADGVADVGSREQGSGPAPSGSSSRTTARDVARAAGVSQATVSRVLNRRPGVSQETRERVLRAVSRLGYLPNEAARTLVARKSRTLGLIIADITNPFYAETAKVVAATAQDMGYSVILCNTDNDPRLEEEYLQVLMSRQVDGILFGSVRMGDESVRRLIDSGFPVVMYNRYLGPDVGNYVVIDNVKAAYEATRYLISLGHREIAFLAGPEAFSTAYERKQGFLHALRDEGLTLRPQWVCAGMYRSALAYQVALRLLTGTPRPTAILAANDLMAFGVLDAAVSTHVSVPAQLSVMGFDDVEMASHQLVRLSTVSQDRRQMAEIAVRALLDLVEGKATPPLRTVLPPTLIIRATTAPPPGGEPARPAEAATAVRVGGASTTGIG